MDASEALPADPVGLALLVVLDALLPAERLALVLHDPALVNGAGGVVVAVDGKPVSIVGFTFVNDTIIAVDALADPERIGALDLGLLHDRSG